MSVPKDSDDFSVGKVVSINNNGNLQLGGGFTLYKDVYVSHHLQARYLRVAYIGSHILVSAYNSYIQIFLQKLSHNNAFTSNPIISLLFLMH